LNAKPTLTLVQQMAWDAFSLLHQLRTVGFSEVNPIPVSEAKIMAALIGYADEYEFVQLIVRLDLCWRRLEKERQGQSA